MMRRREFITLLGGAAAAWPVAARAQQRRLPVVGYLHAVSPEGQEANVASLRKGLGEHGLVEGRNFAIDYRFANNDYNRLPELAADLVRQRVNVIATPNGDQAARAAKAATTAIPIVFGSTGDPVKNGLVASYNRPGGNLTGVTSLLQELGAKRLELLHELLPGATRFAVLVHEGNPLNERVITDLRAAASSLGFQIEVLSAGTNRDIDMAFAALPQKRADALLTAPSPLFGARRLQLTTLAARYALPVMYHDRLFTEAGGLMSYGTSLADIYRQVGAYTGRIVKGEKPADLPVLQPTKFEFVINLQAGRTIGLDVPATLVATADEVIE